MVEFYYWREGSGGKSRLETVVLFLPDVWSAQPSRVEWANVQEQYKAACEAAMKKLDGETAESGSEQPQQPQPAATPAGAPPAPPAAGDHNESADNSKIVCSQFCFVTFPAASSTLFIGAHHLRR